MQFFAAFQSVNPVAVHAAFSFSSVTLVRLLLPAPAATGSELGFAKGLAQSKFSE